MSGPRINTKHSSPQYEAEMTGARSYHGSECKNCGTTEKFTENRSCVQCNRTRTRERARRKRQQAEASK